MIRRAFSAALFVFFAFALLVVVATAARPTSRAMTSTLEVLVQPEAAMQLEAQRQAHALQIAEVDARLANERAKEATVRLAMVLGALLLMGAAALLTWAATRRAGQQVTIMLEGDTPYELEAQWRVIDAQMVRKGYELEE